MTPLDLGPCEWCGKPADRRLTIKPGVARQTTKGHLVTALPTQLLACPEHAHQLYRHNAERVSALYRQAELIAAAEQLKLC